MIGTVPVRTWVHQRKGILHGRMVADLGTWVDIELVGDHGRWGLHGDRLRVRASFLRDVTP